LSVWANLLLGALSARTRPDGVSAVAVYFGVAAAVELATASIAGTATTTAVAARTHAARLIDLSNDTGGHLRARAERRPPTY
jgi:hypothetical protein